MSDRMDSKLREMTYRLIAMAPEAPPFPEERMVQVQKPPVPAKPVRPRRPLVVLASAALAALVLIGVPLMLIGGEEDPGPTVPPVTEPTTPDTPTPSTTTPSVNQTTVFYVTYLLSDDQQTATGDPMLVPVYRTETLDGDLSMDDVSALAIDRLRDVPGLEFPPGYSTAVPADAAWTDFQVNDGIVTIDFPASFAEGGGSASMFARLRQVVFTATAQPGIDAVLFEIEGEPVGVFSSEGIILDGPQTRADWLDDAQAIYLDSPAAGAEVWSGLSISGTANVFEGTLLFEVATGDGTVIAGGVGTASCGTGCWGDFTLPTLYLLDGDIDGFVTVFTESPLDGSRQNVITVPVLLHSGEDPEAPSFGLNVGIEELDFGAGYEPGRIVTTSPITVAGGADPNAEVSVNGILAERFGLDGFRASVDLTEGGNSIVVEVLLDGQSYTETLRVRYLPGGSVEFTYLDQVGADEIVADYAQWLSGDEANQAAFEDGVISSVEEGVPNDYYIRNVNDQLRTLPVAGDVVVILQTSAPGPVGSVTVPVDEWLALFKADGTPWNYELDTVPDWPAPDFGYFGAGTTFPPYWLTLDADGTVVQIEQQYIP